MAAGIGFVLEVVDELFDLIDHAAIGANPRAPLAAIHGAEVAVFIRPLIPDADAVFLEIGDVGAALEKPQQFVDDGAQVEFFGGETGKALPQIIAHLAAKDGDGARARAVGARLAVF